MMTIPCEKCNKPRWLCKCKQIGELIKESIEAEKEAKEAIEESKRLWE